LVPITLLWNGNYKDIYQYNTTSTTNVCHNIQPYKAVCPVTCQAGKKGGRRIALPILNLSTRRVGSWYDALLLYFPKETWYPWTDGGVGLGTTVDGSRKSCLPWGLNPAICNW